MYNHRIVSGRRFYSIIQRSGYSWQPPVLQFCVIKKSIMSNTKMNTQQQVWFVTGASKGLGADLVKRLLSEGYRVAATSRNRKALTGLVDETENFLALNMDVTSNENVKEAIHATVE